MGARRRHRRGFLSQDSRKVAKTTGSDGHAGLGAPAGSGTSPDGAAPASGLSACAHRRPHTDGCIRSPPAGPSRTAHSSCRGMSTVVRVHSRPRPAAQNCVHPGGCGIRAPKTRKRRALPKYPESRVAVASAGCSQYNYCSPRVPNINYVLTLRHPDPYGPQISSS